MNIKKARLIRFRNEEFFQFFTEFKELVATYGLENRFFGEYEKLLALYSDLDDAVEQIRKSGYTSEITEADNLRDMVFAGLRDTVKAALNHFDEGKQKAAAKLMLVFNTYGNVSQKGYAAETASVYNLVQDLRQKYADETATLSLQEWVDKLEEYNIRFSTLMNARDREKSLKPQKRIVEIRKDMETCYGNMVRCMEVATLAQPDENLMLFINELVSKIARFANILSSREGRKKNNEE